MEDNTTDLPSSTFWRLAFVCSLILAPTSCWVVTLPTYIAANTGLEGSRLFSAGFIGWAGATGAFGALISPLLVGAFADRWLGADRIVPILQFCCGGCLWCLTRAESQGAFWLCLLCYFIFFAPISGLMNVVCFRNLRSPIRQFPRLRALTTLSWIWGCWLVGYVGPLWFGHSIEATTMPLRIAACLHFLVGLSALALPDTPPDRTLRPSVRRIFGGDAVAILVNPALTLLIAAVAILAAAMQFYAQFANVYLNRLGVPGAAGVLSWGQVTELLGILVLPLAIGRFGFRWTMIFGTLTWVIRFLLFALSEQSPLLYWLAILLHGFSFSFCFIALQMAVDEHAARSARSATQGLISLITAGMGTLFGAVLIAVCQARFLTPTGIEPAPYDWKAVWYVAAGLATIPLVLLLVSRIWQPALTEKEPPLAAHTN